MYHFINNVSIKVKIIVSAICMFLFLTLVTEYFVSSKSTEVLLKQSFAKLTTSRDIKKQQLEDFFRQRVIDVETMAKSKDVQNLVLTMIDIHDELGVGANELFPVKNKNVISASKYFEKFFQSYVKDYGYYDLFIICKKHGHVMYSATKESDYGENLHIGKLKESGLAHTWKKVVQGNKTAFDDMEPYAPSNNEPAMFVGTPVHVDEEFRAVLVLQINDKAINDITTFRKGYGKTQEDYLVGPDKLMRSDSYLDVKGHSLRASFANPKTGSVDTKASQAAIKGEIGQDIVIDYNGNPVLSSYAPIKIDDTLQWALMSEIDEAEVMIVPAELRKYILTVGLIIMLFASVLTFFVLNKIFVFPMKELENRVKDLAEGDGDLRKRIDISSQNEIGKVSKHFNTFIKKVQETVKDAKTSSLEMSSAIQKYTKV